MSPRYLRTYSAIVLPGMALAAGCSASGGLPATLALVRDSAGVTIVENRGPDRPLGWRLEMIAVVAATDSGADFTQLDEYTVTADTIGHIYVVDSWYGQRIQMLDTMGQILRRLTRGGAGPGEVGSATSISATGDGTLNAMDFTKTGMVRVRWDGTVLPVLSLAGYGLFGGGRATADTVVLHTIDSRPPDYAEQLRYRTDSDSATLVTHTPTRLGLLHFCGHGMEGLPPMLAPELRWTARGSASAANHTAEYRIEWFAGARLDHVVRREGGATAGTVDAVGRFFPDGKIVAARDCVVPPAELVAKRGVSDVVQPIRRLAIDPEGRLWAERNTFPNEPGRTDVFDAAGQYLGTLPALGIPLGFPAPGLFLFALPDSLSDIPKLGIYRRTR